MFSSNLKQAIHEGDTDAIKKLIEQKADINQKDKKGQSPLHLAAIRGCPTIIKLLIENNADITQKNEEGFTFPQLMEKIFKQSDIELEKAVGNQYNPSSVMTSYSSRGKKIKEIIQKKQAEEEAKVREQGQYTFLFGLFDPSLKTVNPKTDIQHFAKDIYFDKNIVKEILKF